MEVTQIIIDGDGFDSKDDHEFMHNVGQQKQNLVFWFEKHLRIFHRVNLVQIEITLLYEALVDKT